jgi:hypothetical protein
MGEPGSYLRVVNAALLAVVAIRRVHLSRRRPLARSRWRRRCHRTRRQQQGPVGRDSERGLPTCHGRAPTALGCDARAPQEAASRHWPSIWPTNACPLMPEVPNSVPAMPNDRAGCRLFPRQVPHWQCGGQGFESPQLHPMEAPESGACMGLPLCRTKIMSVRCQGNRATQGASGSHVTGRRGMTRHKRAGWPRRSEPRRKCSPLRVGRLVVVASRRPSNTAPTLFASRGSGVQIPSAPPTGAVIRALRR